MVITKRGDGGSLHVWVHKELNLIYLYNIMMINSYLGDVYVLIMKALLLVIDTVSFVTLKVNTF